jgi:hypothetical protein
VNIAVDCNGLVFSGTWVYLEVGGGCGNGGGKGIYKNGALLYYLKIS